MLLYALLIPSTKSSLYVEQTTNIELVEQYSVAFARWKQCEQAITKFGFLGRHPTVNQSMIQSPFVAMSHSYQKQTSQLWFQIYSIIKENCSVDAGFNAGDDPMESLLRSRGK